MQIALTKEKRILYGIILVLMALVWTIPDHLLFDPTRTLCIHKHLLGLECPMCGMTRASHELLHLHFYQAAKYNSVVFFWAGLIAIDVVTVFKPVGFWFRFRKITFMATMGALVVIYLIRIYKAWDRISEITHILSAIQSHN